jgi:hypothetical protein
MAPTLSASTSATMVATASTSTAVRTGRIRTNVDGAVLDAMAGLAASPSVGSSASSCSAERLIASLPATDDW